jgi:hypothetical protein
MGYGWDPTEWESVRDVPLLGDLHKGLFGDPEAIKASYDQAIGLSQQGGKDIQNFLMGQQGKAQQYFAPIQGMFQNAYGTQGLKPQQTAVDPNIGPIQAMYGGR